MYFSSILLLILIPKYSKKTNITLPPSKAGIGNRFNMPMFIDKSAYRGKRTVYPF